MKTTTVKWPDCLIPEIIADAVMQELSVLTGRAVPAKHADTLVKLAIYHVTHKTKGIYFKDAGKVRDALYVFMRHWLAAECQGYVNEVRINDTFRTGRAK